MSPAKKKAGPVERKTTTCANCGRRYVYNPTRQPNPNVKPNSCGSVECSFLLGPFGYPHGEAEEGGKKECPNPNGAGDAAWRGRARMAAARRAAGYHLARVRVTKTYEDGTTGTEYEFRRVYEVVPDAIDEQALAEYPERASIWLPPRGVSLKR